MSRTPDHRTPDHGTPDHRALRESLGAFALGHLPRDEAADVAEHLTGCASCRADLEEIAPAAAALADARQPVAAASPPPGLGWAIEERIRQESRRSSSWHTARTALASALVTAAVIATVVVGLDLPRSGPEESVALEAVDVTEVAGIEATADLVAHTWGVEVKLTASGLRPGAAYQVAVLTADGTESPAGAFVGTDGQMRCNLNAAVLRQDAVGFLVRDDAGATVVQSSFAA